MLRLRVSDIAQSKNCPKRARLQTIRSIDDNNKTRPMKYGIELHNSYARNNIFTFRQEVLVYNLESYGVFERYIGNDIVVRGLPDNYRLLASKDGYTVSIIEVKTTSKQYLYSFEYECAILQVRLYAWLLEPYIKELGYKLHNRMYVEVFSQKDHHLIKRIPVEPNTNTIEQEILDILDVWDGLKPAKYPDYWVCKHCPKAIKEKCGRNG